MTIKSGIAHVAGLYPTSSSFVTLGANAIKALGPNSKTIKLFFTSDYATKYPNQTGWGTVANMVDLASSTPMATVLGDAQFTDYFINVFPWWSNWAATSLTNYWVNSPVVNDASSSVTFATILTNETTAMQNLAAHLLTTYAGTGKRFVLQNWEGDWSLLNAFDANATAKADWAMRMANVYQARARGVAAARAASSAIGVSVEFAVEVNRSLDGGRRVHRDVLPYVPHDRVSWSAYEGLTYADVMSSGSITAARTAIDYNMRRFNAEIRKYSSAPIYIGEFGWPEAEFNTTTYPPGDLIQQVLETGDALGWTHAVYWQIYDNSDPYRGFALIKADSTDTYAGMKFRAVFA